MPAKAAECKQCQERGVARKKLSSFKYEAVSFTNI